MQLAEDFRRQAFLSQMHVLQFLFHVNYKDDVVHEKHSAKRLSFWMFHDTLERQWEEEHTKKSQPWQTLRNNLMNGAISAFSGNYCSDLRFRCEKRLD